MVNLILSFNSLKYNIHFSYYKTILRYIYYKLDIDLILKKSQGVDL